MQRITLLTSALAGLAALAVSVLATACGSTAAPGTGIHPATQHTTIRTGTGIPSDPHSAANAQALRLLDGLRLPPGSNRVAVPARPIPDLPTTGTGFSQSVTITRLYRLTVSRRAAYAWLLAHRPAGAIVSDHGGFGQRNRVVADLVDFSVRPLPSWLYSARLYTAVKTTRGGSLLLEEAQAQWYPARGAAGHIDPARYVSVTVSRLVNHHVTARTLGEGPLRRLAAVVNALHAMPDIATDCPAMGPGIPAYRLTFNPAGPASPASTTPRIVVDPTRCLAVDVTVGGLRVQPLYPASSLITAAQSILRTTAPG